MDIIAQSGGAIVVYGIMQIPGHEQQSTYPTDY